MLPGNPLARLAFIAAIGTNSQVSRLASFLVFPVLPKAKSEEEQTRGDTAASHRVSAGPQSLVHQSSILATDSIDDFALAFLPNLANWQLLLKPITSRNLLIIILQSTSQETGMLFAISRVWLPHRASTRGEDVMATPPRYKARLVRSGAARIGTA